MHTFYFEKLEVWQDSRLLIKKIYELTKRFPGDEKYGLTSQTRRAAISISSNIAEGSSRFSDKDKARFMEIAFGSSLEVLNLIILAFDLKYIESEEADSLRTQVQKICNRLNAFRKKLII